MAGRVQQQQAATGWDPYQRSQGGPVTVQVSVRNSHLTSPAQSGPPGPGAQTRHAAVSHNGVPGPTYTWVDHGPSSPLRPDPRDDPPPPGLPSLEDPVFRSAGDGVGGRQYSRPVQVSRPLHYPVAPDPRTPATAGTVSRGTADFEQREPARGRRLWDPTTGEPVTLPAARQTRPPVGATVEIAGLRARQDLNGQKGKVTAHDNQRDDGVVVNTERGEQVYVSARNVRWENEEDPPRPDVGSTVRLKTTKRRPDLEGASGVVVQHDTEDPEGMAVRISASAEIVQVRVRSIIHVPPPPQRQEVRFEDSQYIDSSPRRE